MVGDTPRPGGVADSVRSAEQATDDIVQWCVDDCPYIRGRASRVRALSSRVLPLAEGGPERTPRWSGRMTISSRRAWVVPGGFVRFRREYGRRGRVGRPWSGRCRRVGIGDGRRTIVAGAEDVVPGPWSVVGAGS